MELAIVFILGAILGGIVGATLTKPKTIGTLRVDSSDPEDGPYMFLELAKDIPNITKQKLVSLRVSTQSYISQK